MTDSTDLPNKKTTRATAKVSRVGGVYSGCGGPPGSSLDDNGNRIDPTPAGEYVIQRIGPHVSHGKWPLSMIAWGTPTRIEEDVFEVQRSGKWVAGTTIHEYLTAAHVRNEYKALYAGVDKKAPAVIPDNWVLNDFGPAAVYFFKDLDGDKRFDPATETIQQEMFHTTPDNEMQLADKKEIVFVHSHGCIHVHPGHFREMKKYCFKPGVTVQIHKYSQAVPAFNLDKTAKPPFIIHFFPGSDTILVYGQ